VNREHLRAFLWLRWRLRVNQIRKAGTFNAVLTFVLIGFVLVFSAALFVGGCAAGFGALPDADPAVRLLVWDGVLAAFLLFWLMVLVSDLQRTEALAIDKVLHLPVSPGGAFVVNYLSTLASLTLVAFVPGMVGLILGQVCAGSAASLLALPLLAAFVFALTAVTYQFQGWLAAMMTNPRRRRTVVVLVTAAFVLVAQLPALLGVYAPQAAQQSQEEQARLAQQRVADAIDLRAGRITQEEYDRRGREVEAAQAAEGRRVLGRIDRVARPANAIFPPGWLALGAADLAGGAVAPALLGTLGFCAVGAASLWRAYRTTLRLYTGEFTARTRQRTERRPAAPRSDKLRLTEWRLPLVSEYASAVAAATFRSLARAPEVKMALAAPFLILVMMGTMSSRASLPAEWRPLAALGVAGMVQALCVLPLVGNQFGFDRSGFRAYVLSPLPRREILLGKNLAVVPAGVGAGLVALAVVGVVYPMRADHYAAVAAQLAAGFLTLCLGANAMSILAPTPMAAGSLKPSGVRALPALLQTAFGLTLPFLFLPSAVPFAAELLLDGRTGASGRPVALGLSLVTLGVAVVLYRFVLTRQGNWLAAREQKILDVVTSRE
jgi:hypothetical protein